MNPMNIAYFGILVYYNHKRYHITLEYVGNKPVAYKKQLLKRYPLGEKTHIIIDYFGRYKDENAGFHVVLDDVASPLFTERIPHITTYTAPYGYAVNTWKAFTDLTKPSLEKRNEHLTGTIGYFTHDGKFYTE